jgi:hypothetical protein
MSQQYHQLIRKIEVFIHKYYKNQLIKGLILALSLILSLFLILIFLENLLRLNSLFRAILFYGYLSLGFGVLIFYILYPISGLIKIRKRLSYAEAALIIGKHFPEINDKILNTLQLQNALQYPDADESFLLEAAINQKSEQLSPIPFQSAIQFSLNKKYLKFVWPPLLIILFISWYSPNLITAPSNRIIHYNHQFIDPAPFNFEIENKKLLCEQGKDFDLMVKITGQQIPSDVFIVVDNYPFKASHIKSSKFKYTFKNLLNSKEFYFKSGNIESEIYKIIVNPAPKINGFSIKLKFPNYLNKPDETIQNIGDIAVPEGTLMQWIFKTANINSLIFQFQSAKYTINSNQSSFISPKIVAKHSDSYMLVPINEYISSPDTLTYFIEVIKDIFPSIEIADYRDSLNQKSLYFQGVIKDDYGLNTLSFNWKKIDSKGNFLTKSISIQRKTIQQRFYYYVNADSLKLQAGDAIEYYFEVTDNDAINGSKATRSAMKSFKLRSIEELDSSRSATDKQLKDDMKENMEEAKKINSEIEKLQKKLIDKKQLDWQDKQQLKDLIKRYDKMLKNIEEIKKEQEISQQKNRELTKEDERLIEKQKQLQELFDKLMTPEMKKMMQEINKMMQDELKKEEVQKVLEKIEIENKDIENQLDRDLEMFKQMEFDQKLQEAINQLDSLNEKQEQLKKDIDQKNLDSQDATKKQAQLNKKFEEFKQKLKDAEKANQSLEKPNEMKSFEEDQNRIEQQMEQSNQELEKGNNKAASKLQQSASESMEKLSEKLKQMQSEMESEAAEENIEDLKNLLSNLIESSFNQEKLLLEVKNTSHTDPKYPQLIRRQKEIKMDLKMIEDSLLSLSKRQASISPMVNKEIVQINQNMDKTMESLLSLNTIGPTSSSQKNTALANQQGILESLNNLALMLSESLEQMQQQQKQQKGGKPSCKKPKPGQGKGNMKSIREMQQALNEQMKKMQEQMKSGKQDGPQKGNGKPGDKGEKISEEISKMAAQQELIRQKLQEYQDALKKEGRGKEAQKLNKTIKDMETNETELVNQMILQESLLRQQEILTRLLEAEDAEREQKKEDQRESKEGIPIDRKIPPEMEQFIKKQNQEVELIKTIPPHLKPFYKNKVNKYFERINNQ